MASRATGLLMVRVAAVGERIERRADAALERFPPAFAVVAIGLLLVFLRDSRPGLAWEDGPIFWAGASGGLASLLEPYAGYFHPLARIIALIAWTAGTWQIDWIASILIALFVAAYVASDHMTGLLPARWQRLAAGVGVLVLPGSSQIMGLLGVMQWYGEIYLLAWLVAGSANRVALAAFALSGPFSVLFAPLVLLRRPAGWPIVMAGAVVQGFGYLISPRGSPLELDRLGEVLAFRGVLGPFFGEFSANGVPIVVATGGVLVVGALSLAAIVSDRTLIPVFAGAAVVAILGVMFAGESNQLLLMGAGARYFVGLGFGFTLFVLRSPRSPLAWAIGCLLAAGIVHDFRIPSRDFYGWP